jgi:hypothetical protein
MASQNTGMANQDLALLAGPLLPSSSPSPLYVSELSGDSDSNPDVPGLDWEKARLGLDCHLV